MYDAIRDLHIYNTFFIDIKECHPFQSDPRFAVGEQKRWGNFNPVDRRNCVWTYQYLTMPHRKTDLKKPNKFEAKIILARTVSKFNLAANPVYELFRAPDVEHELGPDIGLSWQFRPYFTAGIESASRFEFEDVCRL